MLQHRAVASLLERKGTATAKGLIGTFFSDKHGNSTIHDTLDIRFTKSKAKDARSFQEQTSIECASQIANARTAKKNHDKDLPALKRSAPLRFKANELMPERCLPNTRQQMLNKRLTTSRML